MRQRNVVASAPTVISARKSAEFLRLNNATFFRAVAGRILRPQARIEGGVRDALGFVEGYLEDIDKVLPRDRGAGQPIFSREVEQQIEKINQRWEKMYPQMREG